LENFYNNGRFIYATTTLPVGEEPLDQFLFDKKRGNCEFFASSLATLLRVAGVPSRLIGGYYGGEYNEVGGYYLVTEAMAHVWVEVYLAGKGWVTVDPSQWAVNSAGIRQAAPPGLFRRIGMSLDAFGYFWNMAVINYDLEKQAQLLSKANNRLKGLSFAGFMKYLPLFTGILLVVAMMVVLPRSWRGRSPEERILRKLLRLTAARRGIAPDPATGILELADSIKEPSAQEFAAVYAGAVYRDRRLCAAEIRKLTLLLGAIKRSPVHKENNGRGL
jgi:hypothetical protein